MSCFSGWLFKSVTHARVSGPLALRAGPSQTYLAYIMEVSKESNCFSTLVSFPTRHDRFLKDHLNMLNFPFFVKVFRTLWAIN